MASTNLPQPLPAFVSWPSAPLTDSLVRKALHSLHSSVNVITSIPDDLKSGASPILQWSAYDETDHELTHLHRKSVLSSCYTFRKSLIRKHFLSRSIHSYVTKNPKSILQHACPKTFELELSFADELDEMWTDELWELGEQLETSQSWWILKPGMADRGNGIRLFHSKNDLQGIFESFEEEEEDEEDELQTDSGLNDNLDERTAVVTSQLRHFVIQEYILNPLLVDPAEAFSKDSQISHELQGHKFHLRAYCVASGALRLYLCTQILALFSSVPYSKPSAENSEGTGQGEIDLAAHLTNSSLQTHNDKDVVRLLDELVGCKILSGGDDLRLTKEDVESLVSQMGEVLAETFRAALQNPVHFQPLPNAFELYGVDFLVSHNPFSSTPLQVEILEVNAEPAIELTGPRLSWILEELFKAIADACVEPFFCGKVSQDDDGWAVGDARGILMKCLDEQVRPPGDN